MNRDDIREWCRENGYHLKKVDRDKLNASQKEWRDKNREHLSKWQKDWYETPAGKAKKKRDAKVSKARHEENKWKIGEVRTIKGKTVYHTNDFWVRYDERRGKK